MNVPRRDTGTVRVGIKVDGVIHVVRELCLQILHQLADAIHCLHGVVARKLKDVDDRGGRSVQPPDHVIQLGAEFHSGHIAEPEHGAVGVFADDYVAKVFIRYQEPLGPHGVGELLPRGSGFRAYLSRGVDRVLLLDRLDEVRNRNPEAGETVRFHPISHRIGASALNNHRTDTTDPCERVSDVDEGIIRQERRVSGSLRRRKSDDHQRANVGLGYGDALLPDGRGKLGQGPVDADLRKHFGNIGIHAQVEVDSQLHRAVVGVERPHVGHAFDACHRLFERGRNRTFDCQGIRAHEIRCNNDLRRGDTGKLRDGKPPRHNDASEHDENRNHHCRYGPIDEEFRHVMIRLLEFPRWFPAYSIFKGGSLAGLGSTVSPARTF